MIACDPAVRSAKLIDQWPVASAIAVAVETVPSTVKCTVALGLPVPSSRPPSPAVSVTTGPIVSSTKSTALLAVTPNTLLSLATMV